MWRALFGVASATFLLVGPVSANATDQERAGARAAAEAGATRFDQGQWQESISFFEKAESLVHAVPHLLYIARAHEKLGHLVESREAYLKITREPLQPTAPPAFRTAHASAEAELPAVEARVPYLSVSVQGAGELPVRVVMNGEEVPAGLVGVPRPMNPGSYEFQAFAAGNQSNPSTISLREGAKETIILTLQSPSARSAEPAPQPVTSPKDEDTSGSGGGVNGLVVGGIVGLGVGVVGGVLGAVFTMDSNDKRAKADALCSEGASSAGCPASVRDQVLELDDQANAAKTRAIASFVVGGIGLATGATLLVVGLNQGDSKKTGAAPRITPWVSLNSAGFSGTF